MMTTSPTTDTQPGYGPASAGQADIRVSRKKQSFAGGDPSLAKLARPAQEPKGSPAARWLAVVIALALIALGVVAAIEAYKAIAYDQPRASVFAGLFDWISQLRIAEWMLPCGILLIIIALILLWLTFKPRPTTHRRLVGEKVSVWMRPIDIARMCSGQANTVPGVSGAVTAVKDDHVEIQVVGDPSDAQLKRRIETTVGPLVGQIAGLKAMKVAVEQPQED